jgi:putative (di)nucleoside polyphosphate hydrolase
LRVHEYPEFDAWRWAELETLPELIVPFKREIYESVVDAFAKFAVRVQSRL